MSKFRNFESFDCNSLFCIFFYWVFYFLSCLLPSPSTSHLTTISLSIFYFCRNCIAECTAYAYLRQLLPSADKLSIAKSPQFKICEKYFQLTMTIKITMKMFCNWLPRRCIFIQWRVVVEFLLVCVLQPFIEHIIQCNKVNQCNWKKRPSKWIIWQYCIAVGVRHSAAPHMHYAIFTKSNDL